MRDLYRRLELIEQNETNVRDLYRRLRLFEHIEPNVRDLYRMLLQFTKRKRHLIIEDAPECND